MKHDNSASHQADIERDMRIVSLVIENATKKTNGPSVYKAPWLLSDFDDDLWETTNRGREVRVKEKLRSGIVIDWNFALPDGSNSTDIKNRALLNLSKKIAFRLRDGGVEGSFGVISWQLVVNTLKQFICWMVLNKRRLGPENYLFSRINRRDIDSLMSAIASGGWFNALNYPMRVLKAISREMGCSLPSEISGDNIMKLPSEFTTQVIHWLDSNGFYKKVYRGTYYGKEFVNRGMISKLIGVDSLTVVSSKKFTSFLRQFEPDFWFSPLVVSVVQRHEFPDQNCQAREKFNDLSIRKKDLEIIAESLFKIFNMASAIDGVITPYYLASLPKQSYLKFSGLCEGQGRTKLIPVDIGLTYFNTAICWIESYGDAIVDCYVDSIGSINIHEYERLSKSAQKLARQQAFLTPNLNTYKFKKSKIKAISDFIDTNSYSRSSVKFGYSRMRAKPSLEEAIRILVGACVVCISICKPSRNDEIVNLNRNCLVLKDDGYYLNFNLGKSNHNDYYQEVEKPIPFIVAKAIKLLQRLGESIERTSKSENRLINRGKLFNLPSYSVGRPRLISSNILCDYLDVFCDYVNIPPVNGVRWYVRTHEMRKWFLLLLFWGNRNDVLDACRWIAGHTDTRHIYNYIQCELPGEELPALEAQYAMDRLMALDMENGSNDVGLHNIYKRVLSHFKVTAISLIPSSEWEDYVSELHQRKEFTIEHQFIYDKSSTVLNSVEVSFVLRKQ